MRPHPIKSRVATVLLLAGAGISAAVADDGIALNIKNDGIQDILVTVYDLGTNPPTPVMQHTRLNGFSSAPITVSSDDVGRANVSWTAVTVDSDFRRCGHGKRRGVRDGASVRVRAHSHCAEP